LQASLRSYDAVGRYGGEEFLVVAPGCTSSSALHLAERLRFAINREPVRLTDRSIDLTISLGVTVSVPGAMSAPETLIRVADEALYRAKTVGRNRVEWTAPGRPAVESPQLVETLA
jgi:diguanylate cyclase (GGDEF)-like protein